MNLPENLEIELRIAARYALPFEACGFVLSDARVMPTRNVAHRGEVAFVMDPEAVLAIYRYAEANELTVIAVYHSHPAGEADWSLADERGRVPNLANILVPIGGRILVCMGDGRPASIALRGREYGASAEVGEPRLGAADGD